MQQIQLDQNTENSWKQAKQENLFACNFYANQKANTIVILMKRMSLTVSRSGKLLNPFSDKLGSKE